MIIYLVCCQFIWRLWHFSVLVWKNEPNLQDLLRLFLQSIKDLTELLRHHKTTQQVRTFLDRSFRISIIQTGRQCGFCVTSWEKLHSGKVCATEENSSNSPSSRPHCDWLRGSSVFPSVCLFARTPECSLPFIFYRFALPSPRVGKLFDLLGHNGFYNMAPGAVVFAHAWPSPNHYPHLNFNCCITKTNLTSQTCNDNVVRRMTSPYVLTWRKCPLSHTHSQIYTHAQRNICVLKGLTHGSLPCAKNTPVECSEYSTSGKR